MEKVISKEKVWTDGNYFTDVVIRVPMSLYLELNNMSFVTDKEFAYLLKVEGDLPNLRVVDWYIPKQVVDYASVKILDRLPDYNGVIHRHPKGVTKFSEQDWIYLNRNYKLSLLYCDGKFTDFAYKIKVGDKYTWLRNFHVIIEKDVDFSSIFLNHDGPGSPISDR